MEAMLENGSRLADRFLKIGITACFVVPALTWSDLVPERFMAPKDAVGMLFVGILVLSIAVQAVTNAPQPIWGKWPGQLLGVPFYAALLSSRGGVRSEVFFIQPTLGGLLKLSGFLGLFGAVWSNPRPWRFSTAILVAGVLNALMALTQSAGMETFWSTAREGRHVVYGMFGNPNLLAEYLAPLAILGFSASLVARERFWRGCAGGATVLFLIVILLTETRAAWVGLLAGFTVLVFLAGAGRIRKLVFGAIAVAMIAISAWAPLRSRVLLGFSGNDPGVATRTFMWRVAAAMFKDHPVLGVGVGGYGLRYLDYAAKVQEAGQGRPQYAGITAQAHCDPLQEVAEGGMLGAVVWIALSVFLLVRALSGMPGVLGRDRIVKATGLAIAATVLAESTVGFPLRSFPTACLLLWGIAVAARPPVFLPSKPIQKWWGLSVGVLAIGWGTAVAHGFLADAYGVAGRDRPDGAAILERGLKLSPDLGELRFRLGIARMREGRMDEAAKEFERALPVYPDPDVRFNLGYIALQKKDYPKAEEWFREGLRRYPYFKAPAWADYALALNGLGRREGARQAAERALEIDPGLGRARVFLTELDKKGRRN